MQKKQNFQNKLKLQELLYIPPDWGKRNNKTPAKHRDNFRPELLDKIHSNYVQKVGKILFKSLSDVPISICYPKRH